MQRAYSEGGKDMPERLLILNFIVPFVMILVGVVQRKFPADNMGAHERTRYNQNGYSTPVSTRSQAHWDYAQKIAPVLFIRLGKYLFAAEAVLGLGLFLLRVFVYWILALGSGLGFAGLIGAFLYTDAKIEAFVREKSDDTESVA